MEPRRLSALVPVAETQLWQSRRALAAAVRHLAALEKQIALLSQNNVIGSNQDFEPVAAQNADAYCRWKSRQIQILESLLAAAQHEQMLLLAENGRNFARDKVLRARLSALRDELRKGKAAARSREDSISAD